MNNMNYYGAPHGNIGGQDSATFQGPDRSLRVAIGAGRMPSLEKLILDINDEDQREVAVARLSNLSEQNIELFHELGPLIWFSFGTMTNLVKEVISVYPLLSPPTLTLAQSERVRNVVLLLQCVASHPDTRIPFLNSCIPLYLFPFIETTYREEQLELLRCCSLGVFGRLVETSDSQVVAMLLDFELMPRVLRAMDLGTELSKTMGTFILMRIMVSECGLRYLCSKQDKMGAVVMALKNMVAALVKQPSVECLKYTITCYWLLSDNEYGLHFLRYDPPVRLSDGTFQRHISEDMSRMLFLLHQNVQRSQLQYNCVVNSTLI